MGNNDSKKLIVRTNHKHPIYFAIHYLYTNDVWYTAGWWSVTNTSQCRPDIETNNGYLYFHGHCGECDAEWGDPNYPFLCRKNVAFDSTNNPSNRKDYEYRDFNEVFFDDADNCTYTFD